MEVVNYSHENGATLTKSPFCGSDSDHFGL